MDKNKQKFQQEPKKGHTLNEKQIKLTFMLDTFLILRIKVPQLMQNVQYNTFIRVFLFSKKMSFFTQNFQINKETTKISFFDNYDQL